MANPNKNRGSQFERDLVGYLKENGYPEAERMYGAGRPDDRGDVRGIPNFVLEAKNCQKQELAKWMDELENEIKNAGVKSGAVIAKRRNYRINRSYAIMSLDMLLELLKWNKRPQGDWGDFFDSQEPIMPIPCDERTEPRKLRYPIGGLAGE